MRPIPEFLAVKENLTRFTDYTTNYVRKHADITNTGLQGIGPDLPATTTLAPSAFLHKVYGPGTIQTIVAPANFSGLLMLAAPNSSEGLTGFKLGAAGNISIDKRIKVNQGVLLAWFPPIAKWQVLATVGDISDVPATGLPTHAILVGEGSDDIQGVGPLTNGQLPIGKTGADPVAALPASANGTVALTPGAGSLDLATSGPYAPASLTAHAPLVGEGSGSLVPVGPLTNGQLLIGSTGADPAATALGVGNSIVATPGAGSLSIDAVQDIRITALPTFAGVKIKELRSTRTVPAYSASITPDLSAGGIVVVTATNGIAFTINNPTNMADGEIWILRIANASGGALGAVTWGAAFKQGTFTAPANGFSRAMTFFWDGTNHWKTSESGSDL